MNLIGRDHEVGLISRGVKPLLASIRQKLFARPRLKKYNQPYKYFCMPRTTPVLIAMIFALAPETLCAQTSYYQPQGTEYSLSGSLPGDQMFSDVAISTNGGYVVWQDNATDGQGWGISATRLGSTLSPDVVWHDERVNIQGAGDQENPRVALMPNDGAAFVWQGGPIGFQHIYARFLSPDGTFISTNDVMVNASTNYFQINPAIATLSNGNVVVVWASFDQAAPGSMQDVYAQIFSPTGKKIGGEFIVNQTTTYNQRTPAVAALADGGFVVTWVSEGNVLITSSGTISTTASTAASLAGTAPSVNIMARVFDGNGLPISSEFIVNTGSNPCANPSVAAASGGSYMIAWDARDMANVNNSLDVYGRVFKNTSPLTSAFYLNSYLYGDQYAPRVCSMGSDYFVCWTSLMQDGSAAGVFGQFVHSDGTFVGNEFRVNTTTAGPQEQPVVSSDGAGHFLAVWSSFTGTSSSFDLYAQQYHNVSAVLEPLSAPFVWAPFVTSNNVYQPQLVVTWATMPGITNVNYHVFVDGASSSIAMTTNNYWVMTSAEGLTTNSSHTFQINYSLADGRTAPLSAATSGKTWSGKNWNGIPYGWMSQYFGNYTNTWWSPSKTVALGGPTLRQVFLSGANPFVSSTWLVSTLTPSSQGFFLNWNARIGAVYQVQVSTNFETWKNVAEPRVATKTQESQNVGKGSMGYYRVVFLR